MNYYDLTNPQKTIWSMEQYYKNTNINNICGTLTIKQNVDLDNLSKAVNIFVKNNKSFGLTFKEDAGKVLQYFTEQEEKEYEIVYLKDYKEVQNLAYELNEQAFNIYDKGLYKFILYKLENGYGGFIIIAHHIISDAATFGLIGTEIVENYAKLLKNEEIEKKDYSYEDYIQDEKKYMNSAKFIKDEEYWNNLYSNVPDIAEIPSLNSKNYSNLSGKAKRKEFIINEKLLLDIAEFCRRNKLSNYNFFMAVYSIYLSRVSNLKDFVIGTPILNRSSFKEKHTTGMFINTAPLRINVNDNESFVSFVKQIAQSSLSMLRYQKYPYEMLLKNLRKKESNLPALFDVMLSYQITKANDKSIQIPYEVEWLGTSTISNGLYIHMHDNNDKEDLNIAYDYQIEKYDERDIEYIHNRILYIIKQVLEDENIFNKDIEIITPEEKNKILYEFNNMKLDYPINKTVIQLFEEQVQRGPNNVAVVFENKSLTYKELNDKANTLAEDLILNNVQYKDVVGVFLPRSIEFIISILAILKCGGAYMPLHIGYPDDRINYMIENSNAKLVITNHALDNKISLSSKVLLTNFENINSTQSFKTIDSMPNDIAYIIYTSGSTGRPKGVQITNKCLNNFVHSFNKYFSGVSDKDNFLSSTNISFDVSIFELFLPLLKGASLVLYHEELIRDILDYCDYIVEHDITGLYIPPNILNEVYFILKDKENVKINKLLVGVEAIRKETLDKYFLINPNMHIVNGYGPTETTICCTALYYTKDLLLSSDIVPIGNPLYNDNVYILDNNQKIQPIGVAGELYITGAGVGAGYVNNAQETSKNYVSNVFDNSSEKMYRTGDIGKWNEDGTISLAGRKDSQIKIRGFRVELNEINNILANFDNVKECTTVVLEIQNKKSICSYYVSKDNNTIDKNLLKSYLSKFLPNYMIPSYFCKIDTLPLTMNGKIDKKKLPIPTFENNKTVVKPKNEIEEKLLSIFKVTLNLDNISTTDSFFELSGDSLLAIKLILAIQEKLQIKINMQILLENPTITQLSKFILNMNYSLDELNTITKATEKELYHLSSAQKRIYYSSKMAGESSTLYNLPGIITFDKNPDIEKLNECFKKLIQKHSILRTYFEVIDDEVYQKVAPNVNFKVDEILKDNENIENIMKDFVKPFDFTKAPLFRACLVKQGDKSLLLFDMHHIICDGTSLSIFARELSELYNGESLSDLSFDYIDYSEWEFENLKNGNFNKHKDFWLNEFKDNIPVLDFPTDYVRPNIQSFEGDKICKTIDANFANDINNLAKKLDVSVYMLLLSAYYVLLSKYSGLENIVVGTPVIGRNKSELLNMIGMFVNTLPLKNYVDNNLSFIDFLNSVKSNCIKAFNHQLYPFDELINDLNIERDNSRQPLFDTMFIYQNNGFPPISFDGIKSDITVFDAGISKFDFSLEVVPNTNSEMNLSFEYCTKLFKKETVENIAYNFINILKELIKNCNVKICDIDILSIEQKNKILYEFNNTKMDYPKNKTIIQLFEEQVQKTPNNIAVVFEDKKLTYKELNEKANNLAWHLRNINIGRNDIVSIMVNRSLELIISILAVLKSGGCYIPIDPNYPKDRTEYMLKNSNCKLLLTSSSLYDIINFENKISIDLCNNYFVNNNSNLPNISKPDDISYIIYTSGSTGMPKGVVLKQQSLTNLAYFLNDYVCFLKSNNYIAIASVTTASFDIFIFETLVALQKGHKVVIANEEEQRLPNKLDAFIKNNNIKAIQMTPSRMRIFLDNIKDCPNLSNLDYVVLAGEPLPDTLLKDLLSLGIKKVYNGYGPSETTVFSSFTDVTNYDTVNIGKPLANTQMYILDKNLSPVPIGIPGELYIAGDGVGKGYLNNEDITKERFVKNPFEKDSIMYKTGDCCKFLDNGEISYIERLDNQVKIRGLRIELGEIEARLLKMPSIKKAKVIKQKIDDRDFISAYYVSDVSLKSNEIRKFLSDSLPDYMLPSYFTPLKDFPYTPNGKIDKNALPLPDISSNLDDNIYIAPRNSIEIALVEILENIFKTSNISILDNFYTLGGDSLTTIALCTNVRQKLNVELSFRDVMQNPIIEDLAIIIENAPKIDVENSCIKKCQESNFYPTSSAQKRMYLASRMDENSTLYNIYGGILLDSMPDVYRLQTAINILVSRHEVLRTHFDIISGQIVQKIEDNLKVSINIQDVNTNEPQELFYIYKTAFNLENAPLFNVVLFKLPNGKILLMLDIHHIIFDGTSLNNLIQELSSIYNEESLPDLDISYKDFAVWENDKLKSNGFESSKRFWHEQFAGDIPVLNLPEVFERPANKSYEGKVYTTLLSKEITNKINDFAIKYNVTPYMVMLSCYYILLNKYTDNEDIIVGTPVSGRLHRELEPLLGMFVNSVPLRINAISDMKFKDFMQNVKTICLNAFAHQDYPFDLLINDLKIKKDPSRSILFDTMFTYQNNGISKLNFGGINAKYIPPKSNSSKFDVSLEILPLEDELKISFEYCIKIFDEIFIGNFAKSYENILVSVLDNPDIYTNDISITNKESQNNFLYKLNHVNLHNNKEVSNKFEMQTNITGFNNIDKLENALDSQSNNVNKLNSNVFSSFTNKNDYDTISKEIYNTNYIAPRNDIETQVASVFQNLLSVPHIGIDDDFFEMGGDSLSAINLQIELLKSNMKLTYADIFSNPTVRTLSEKISSDSSFVLNSEKTDEFSGINKVLESNNIMPEKLNFKEVGNILLTGATGFLGIHILENFLINEKGAAYCLIRPGKSISPLQKFKEKLHYYFGEKYDKFIGDRIIIIDADITKNNLGISPGNLELIFNDISCIINSAAKVSHYGDYKDFKKVNVDSVENLIKLCLKFNKRFYQISTLTVSGNGVPNQPFENDVEFNENNLYIGQALDNVYAKSKFEAEKLILKYVSDGLDAYILRIR